MVSERDGRLRVDSAEKRRERADIAYPPIDAGADAWRQGSSPQLKLKE